MHVQPHCNCQQSPWRRTLAPVPHASNLAQCCRLMRGRGRWLCTHVHTHTHATPAALEWIVTSTQVLKNTRARTHTHSRKTKGESETTWKKGGKKVKWLFTCQHKPAGHKYYSRSRDTLPISQLQDAPSSPTPTLLIRFLFFFFHLRLRPVILFAIVLSLWIFLFSQSADIVLYPKFLTPLCVSYMCRTCVIYLSNMCDSSCIYFNGFLLTTSKFCLSHARTLIICFHSSCLSVCFSPITLFSLWSLEALYLSHLSSQSSVSSLALCFPLHHISF